jgi:glutaredoxin 3
MISKMYTIYTQNSCGYCHMAKNLLNDYNIPFIEISLDHDNDARKMLKGMNCKTVPQIFNGELHIGGFTELRESFNESHSTC